MEHAVDAHVDLALARTDLDDLARERQAGAGGVFELLIFDVDLTDAIRLPQTNRTAHWQGATRCA
jgi:hypothetical protein